MQVNTEVQLCFLEFFSRRWSKQEINFCVKFENENAGISKNIVRFILNVGVFSFLVSHIILNEMHAVYQII